MVILFSDGQFWLFGPHGPECTTASHSSGHFQPYAFRSAEKSGVASLFHFPGPHSFVGFKVHCVLCSGSCLFEYLLLRFLFVCFVLKRSLPFIFGKSQGPRLLFPQCTGTFTLAVSSISVL